jgi:hypothetical protein
LASESPSNGVRRSRRTAATAAVALAACALLLAGCGLQTEEANKLLGQANAHQVEAENAIKNIGKLPAEWESTFNTSGVSPEQVVQARNILAARGADLINLDTALKNWKADIDAIAKLNVDDKIKRYVVLKAASIKQWQTYSEMYLAPLIKAYSGLVETIAQGRPALEQQRAAGDIKTLVSESAGRLEECLNAEKQADSYFKANKLGK